MLTDLEYRGAFRLSSSTFGSSSTNYCLGALAYHAANHSLFIAGHSTQKSVAEFAIPTPSTSSVLTSLPEVVSIWACLRLGLVDMAIGAIFGSNIFNICILVVGDLFYRDGAIYTGARPEFDAHITTIAITAAMTLVAMAALVLRRPPASDPERTTRIIPPEPWHRKPASILLVLLYITAMVMTYFNTR